MERRSSSFPAAVAAILIKDITSEFRNRYAINTLIMFSLVTVTVISISIGQFNISDEMRAAFLWIIIFFSSVSGLGQSFIKEEETGTVLALRLYSNAIAVFASKFIFNTILLLFLELIFIPLFFILLSVECGNLMLLILVIFLGSIGLTGATTLIAAIISKASVKGALFAVLSFPILLPLLIAAIGGTETSLTGGTTMEAIGDLKLLISYPVIMLIASVYLFEYIWIE